MWDRVGTTVEFIRPFAFFGMAMKARLFRKYEKGKIIIELCL